MTYGTLREYVIGLGANLGDRLQSLRSAVEELADLGEIRAISALYESKAVGPPQPDYYNAAVSLATDRDPFDLLEALHRIEQKHGRLRRERWGPRTLDLDILWAGEVVVDTDRLRVPHPELAQRPFALDPLLDVAADANEPNGGDRYRAIRARLDGSEVHRIAGTEDGQWARSDR